MKCVAGYYLIIHDIFSLLQKNQKEIDTYYPSPGRKWKSLDHEIQRSSQEILVKNQGLQRQRAKV